MYRAPGPIQFYSAGARDLNMTLMYELLGIEGAEAITGIVHAYTIKLLANVVVLVAHECCRLDKLPGQYNSIVRLQVQSTGTDWSVLYELI
jgi:hypothetical protein